MAAYLTQNEIHSPYSKAFCDLGSSYLPDCISYSSLLCLFPSSHASLLRHTSMILLWNLWICYFLSLECSSPCTHMACSFTSFGSLLKCHIITESFPNHSF